MAFFQNRQTGRRPGARLRRLRSTAATAAAKSSGSIGNKQPTKRCRASAGIMAASVLAGAMMLVSLRRRAAVGDIDATARHRRARQPGMGLMNPPQALLQVFGHGRDLPLGEIDIK